MATRSPGDFSHPPLQALRKQQQRPLFNGATSRRYAVTFQLSKRSSSKPAIRWSGVECQRQFLGNEWPAELSSSGPFLLALRRELLSFDDLKDLILAVLLGDKPPRTHQVAGRARLRVQIGATVRNMQTGGLVVAFYFSNCVAA